MAKVYIDRQQLIIKLLYFITFAALASWLSYFYIYLKDIPKLSTLEIGVIAGFQQFNNVFVVPIWGLLADKFGRKNTLVVSIGISLLLIPGFLLFDGAIGLTFYMILLTLFLNPIISLLDTIALDYEEQTGGKTSYGEIRLWASIGWASSSFLTGIFISKEQLVYIFPIASFIYLISWCVLYFLYRPLTTTKNLKPISFLAIKQLLTEERKLLMFFFLIFIYSLFSAPIYLIINVYYHEIGATNSIIGLAFAVQAMSELPFFFYGKRLVNRFGARNIFIFTMIATATRMLAYGFNSTPEIAVAIGLIHGISIGLFFVSVIAFVHNIVPSQMRSTGQSLIYTFYAGGVAFGNLLVGLLDNYISIKSTMTVNALAIFALVFVVIAITSKKLGNIRQSINVQ